MGHHPHLWILIAKQRLLVHNYKSLWAPDFTCHFVQAKHRNQRRINKFLVGPRPHLSFCARKTVYLASELLVYGFQLSTVVFGCKTATFGPEQQVSVGPRHHLSFCACKTEWLAQELLVSLGPSSHMWFLHAKQRLLNQINKSLWVQDLTCCFVHEKQRD